MAQHLHFGDLEETLCCPQTAETVILPVPFERTTSYGKGTAQGPAALLAASHYLETYDEELDDEPCNRGIATRPPLIPKAEDLAASLEEIEQEAKTILAEGKFLVTLGGEHSLTQAPVRAARSLWPDVGVVQFDAHADLRNTYEGTPYSHACVMRRLVELHIPTLAVGIRSLSTPEAKLIQQKNLPVIWGHDLATAQVDNRWTQLLERMPEKIYLTFDIDYFDPSLVPATGTPEPGGGSWYPTMALLRQLFATKTVVAMDIVELAPIAEQPSSDFVAAKLLYKCVGYRQKVQD